MKRYGLVVSTALVLALVGCTSSNSADRKPATSGAHQKSASSTPVQKAIAVTQPKSVPRTVPNKVGVISKRLVSVTECKATKGGWVARGTAKSATSQNAHYTVTVFFTTNRATVQAYGQTRVSTGSGRTANWVVASTFRAAPSTLCVLRGAG